MLERRARDIGRQLRCVVCQNQSIDDSDAPLARDLRILVRERLTAGDSDEKVLALTARVSIAADALPGVTFKGEVESLGPASGVSFSPVPPHNATGNFTKVVQRVTARIALDDVPASLAPRLVPGLSATVRVRRL